MNGSNTDCVMAACVRFYIKCHVQIRDTWSVFACAVVRPPNIKAATAESVTSSFMLLSPD